MKEEDGDSLCRLFLYTDISNRTKQAKRDRNDSRFRKKSSRLQMTEKTKRLASSGDSLANLVIHDSNHVEKGRSQSSQGLVCHRFQRGKRLFSPVLMRIDTIKRIDKKHTPSLRRNLANNPSPGECKPLEDEITDINRTMANMSFTTDIGPSGQELDGPLQNQDESQREHVQEYHHHQQQQQNTEECMINCYNSIIVNELELDPSYILDNPLKEDESQREQVEEHQQQEQSIQEYMDDCNNSNILNELELDPSSDCCPTSMDEQVSATPKHVVNQENEYESQILCTQNQSVEQPSIHHSMELVGIENNTLEARNRSQSPTPDMASVSGHLTRRSRRERRPVSRFTVSFRRKRRGKLFISKSAVAHFNEGKEECNSDECDDIEEHTNDNVHEPITITTDESSNDQVMEMNETNLKESVNGMDSNDVAIVDCEGSNVISPSNNVRRSTRLRKPTQRLVVTFTRPHRSKTYTSPMSENVIWSDDEDHVPDCPRFGSDENSNPNNHGNIPNISSAGDEYMNDRGWTNLDMKLLKQAYSMVDPMSINFWDAVAVQVPLKSAMECRAMWFSLVKTPTNKRNQSAKKATAKKLTNVGPESKGYDDIFDSTPLRVLFHINSSRKSRTHIPSDEVSSTGKKWTPSQEKKQLQATSTLSLSYDTPGVPLNTRLKSRFSLEFRSPIVKSDDEILETSLSYDSDHILGAEHTSPIIARAHCKGYIQRLKAEWKEDNVKNARKKSKKKTWLNMDDAMNRDVFDSVEVGDVHMNGVLSPGGTLHIDAPDELELEELFIPSDDDLSHG